MAIAHSIREQVYTYQNSLFLVGNPSDGTAVQDDDRCMSFLTPVTSAARPMDQVQGQPIGALKLPNAYLVVASPQQQP